MQCCKNQDLKLQCRLLLVKVVEFLTDVQRIINQPMPALKLIFQCYLIPDTHLLFYFIEFDFLVSCQH